MLLTCIIVRQLAYSRVEVEIGTMHDNKRKFVQINCAITNWVQKSAAIM